MSFCQPLPDSPPCIWHSQQPYMRVPFSRSLATECVVLEFCQSQRCEMGSQPGLRISITSIIMLDSDSFSCDGSNCTRIDVQGRGGGDGSADVQQWPAALGPQWSKVAVYFSAFLGCVAWTSVL